MDDPKDVSEFLPAQPSFVQASQAAEDFTRVWTSAFEAVMNATRDLNESIMRANHAWGLFLQSTGPASISLNMDLVEDRLRDAVEALRNK
jgi:hypothetical protein